MFIQISDKRAFNLKRLAGVEFGESSTTLIFMDRGFYHWNPYNWILEGTEEESFKDWWANHANVVDATLEDQASV